MIINPGAENLLTGCCVQELLCCHFNNIFFWYNALYSSFSNIHRH